MSIHRSPIKIDTLLIKRHINITCFCIFRWDIRIFHKKLHRQRRFVKGSGRTCRIDSCSAESTIRWPPICILLLIDTNKPMYCENCSNLPLLRADQKECCDWFRIDSLTRCHHLKRHTNDLSGRMRMIEWYSEVSQRNYDKIYSLLTWILVIFWRYHESKQMVI